MSCHVIVELRNELFCFLQCFHDHWFFKRQIVVPVVKLNQALKFVGYIEDHCCVPFIDLF